MDLNHHSEHPHHSHLQTMSSYVPPGWAKLPDSSHEWSLLEIKGGVEIRTYPLHTQACTVLGRAADQVDIPLQHESTSRQHARIAFDSGGYPWLRDLGSTHGTTCNKRRLPPEAIGKTEKDDQRKGSRGVMIFPGDMLQFGASTRIFCVEGPPEFERGAFQARQKQQEQIRRAEVETDVLRQEEGEADTAIEPIKKVVPMDAEVPEKHRKTLERLNAAKYKLQNLQTEDDRIRRKGGDLSEGQERQLQRNAEREKALMESIEELEAGLYDKLYPEQSGKHASTRHGQQELEMEEDEFFDRTKRVEKSVVEDGESETTLIEKWKRLQTQQSQRRSVTLDAAKAKVDRVLALYSDVEARGDMDEAFFVKNDLQLAQEELHKISNVIGETEENLNEIEKLLRLVNPKLKFDRISGYIGIGDPKRRDEETPILESMAPPLPKQHSSTMLPPPGQCLVLQPEDQSSPWEPFSMLPPPPKPVAAPKGNESPKHILPDAVMPPPKRMRVDGPVMPPPQNKACVTNGNMPSIPAKDHHRANVRSTLSFIASSSKNVEATPSLPKDAPSNATVQLTMDPKADTWRAPTGQDGSGKTKLNAKFAGRY